MPRMGMLEASRRQAWEVVLTQGSRDSGAARPCWKGSRRSGEGEALTSVQQHTRWVLAPGANDCKKNPASEPGLKRLTRPAQGGDTGGAKHQLGL